ncbi:MAG: outer membrane lipoprotein carrier protein LolA [Holosporaceae bacterium]|jgi:outer membrane lipoprotein-sorting protein|nr:outer membrane lipoprotein carrier protein LolA [Holosporaceae bacterium]
MLRELVAILLICCCMQQAPAASNSIVKDTEYWIDVVQQFLNGITTLETFFFQRDNVGENTIGVIHLNRITSSLKINSADVVVIVKGNRVTIYDRKLKEKTVTSLHSFPLAFLLEKKIDLRKNVHVQSIKIGDDFLAIKFCKKDDEETYGAITLVFSLHPFLLRKWIIFPDKKEESTDLLIEVSLLNWQYSEDISEDVFSSYSPPPAEKMPKLLEKNCATSR